MIMTATVTDDSFAAEVLQSSQPVLVDFYADWCGPCQTLAPHIEALANEHKDIKVVKMNIDENPMTPTQYGIRSIPTLIVFKGGQAAATKMGSMPKSQLEAWVAEATGANKAA